MQSLFDTGFQLGFLNYWKSNFLRRTMSDEAIDTLVEHVTKKPSPMSGVGLQQMHGAASRVTVNGKRKKTDAVLPLVTKRILERRLHFKGMKKSFEKGSKEWVWCEQRQQAGKMILVCATPDTQIMMADGTEIL